MTITTTRAAALAFVLMVVAIATAWGFQLFGGIQPCPLCLEQRVPYYVAIPLVAVALFVAGRVPLLTRLLLVAAAAAMVWGAGLGVYHAGAEWAFWPGPNTCGGTGEQVRDASSLLAAIEKTTLVTCTQETGRVLGLSFAGWNVVAASASALLLLFGATRRARP